ncbi:MAG: luciferase domain-containing protein [Chitinophagaceae bacterium]
MSKANSQIPFIKSIHDFFRIYGLGKPLHPEIMCMQLEDQPDEKLMNMPLYRVNFFRVIHFTNANLSFYAGDKRVSVTDNCREGQKPTIAPFAVPHRQMNQHNDTVIRNLQKKIFDAQVADVYYNLVYKMIYLERNSAGIFLKDSAAGNASVVPISHAEVGHIHPTDGSMHIILSPSDTKAIIEKGWGELHGLAGQDRAAKTYMMIYAPRNEMELVITKSILEAAVKYASHIAK